MARERRAAAARGAAPAAVAAALERWLASQGLASWDPYDALTSPWLGPLQRWPLPARVCMQAVKRSPVNLRPLLAIPRAVHTKSISDLALVAVLRARAGDPAAAGRATELLTALRQRALAVPAGIAWGMDLPYVSRFAVATPATPNLFQTVNAAAAFLAGYELNGDEQHLATALGVVEFLERGLGRLEETPEQVAWRYYPGQDACVYNVNALIGAWLVRLGLAARREELVTLGRRTLRFVVAAQNPNGSWYYARGPAGRWVDGFHTGYVLEALLDGASTTGDAASTAALARGAAFYLGRLFTRDGLPRYTDRSTYPIEVQNCAQAIQTLARLAQHDPQHLERALEVTRVVIDRLFRWTRREAASEGYFALSRGRWLTNRLAAVRWGQAPMLLALTHLQVAERANATGAL